MYVGVSSVFTLYNWVSFQKLMGVWITFVWNLYVMTDLFPRHSKLIVSTLLSPLKSQMFLKRNRLECTSQRSGKKPVSRNTRLGESCDFLLPNMFSEKVSVSASHLFYNSHLICILVSENTFANNRLSTQLLSNNPLSSMGLHS